MVISIVRGGEGGGFEEIIKQIAKHAIYNATTLNLMAQLRLKGIYIGYGIYVNCVFFFLFF